MKQENKKEEANKGNKGTENLIPLNKRTKAEQRKITRSGGIKSGETRRKQKEIKELMQTIDSTSLPSEQAETYQQVLDIDNPTYREAVVATIYLKALSGDMRAIELYLKLKGEMPKDIELMAGDKSMTIVWNEKRYNDDTNQETE
ncbi:hypothetical protein [Proteiniphilum saccharofermentans]|uniref:hypothetical protein n=1 Tax=Proteiniphilum saccharofermentans TaxID=1642647 RepID=UPI0028AE67A9|nr:hypothetical protein [Proteiniphilum saccharofermentans]